VAINKAGQGQGRAGRPGQTPAHSRSFSVTPGKATMVVSVCVGSAWKILPITARSLWSFPRCNFPREKKEIKGSLIFLGKRFGRPEKKI